MRCMLKNIFGKPLLLDTMVGSTMKKSAAMMSDAAAKDKVRKITKAKNAKEEKAVIDQLKKGVNISLFAANKNPKKSVQGTGFGSAEKARDSIKICERDCRDLTHQKQVIVTMFNRAKFHPHRSAGMVEAMKVFAPWLKRHGMKAVM